MCNEKIRTIFYNLMFEKHTSHDSSKGANITDIINKSYITIAWNECIVYVCLSKCCCVIICYSTCIYNDYASRIPGFLLVRLVALLTYFMNSVIRLIYIYLRVTALSIIDIIE